MTGLSDYHAHRQFTIRMHYGTHPRHYRTPQQLIRELGSAPVKLVVPKPGDKIEF